MHLIQLHVASSQYATRLCDCFTHSSYIHTLRVVASYAHMCHRGSTVHPPRTGTPSCEQGYVNASGTKLQLNGARPRVTSTSPLSPRRRCSITPRYRPHNLDTNTAACNRFIPRADGRGIAMVAICEVINHPSVRRHHQVWVVPDEKHVCARFVPMCTEHASAAAVMSVQTTTPKMIDEIQRAIVFAGCAGSETGGQGKP